MHVHRRSGAADFVSEAVGARGGSYWLGCSSFPGFAAMYSRCLMKLCRHSTRVSEKPRCQTSPQWPHSPFKRYENPPLTNCMALSTVMPSPTVGAKHVDHQRGIPFRLQQGAALAGLGGGEERTR